MTSIETDILRRLKPSLAGAKMLHKFIFSNQSKEQTPGNIRFKKLPFLLHFNSSTTGRTVKHKICKTDHRVLIPLLQSILSKFSKCSRSIPYLLSVHCAATLPLTVTSTPSKDDNLKKKLKGLTFQQLIGLKSPHRDVSSFLYSFCCSLFPQELWGSHHNARVIRRAIQRFVELKKPELISVSHIMKNFKVHLILVLLLQCFTFQLITYLTFLVLIKITDCTWANGNNGNNHSRCMQVRSVRRVSQFLYFMFTYVIVALIRNCFYCTETNKNKLELVYYKQIFWHQIHERSLKYMKKNGVFQKLSTVRTYGIIMIIIIVFSVLTGRCPQNITYFSI